VRRKRIPQSALANEPVILLDEGHCLRQQSLAVCGTPGSGTRHDVHAAGLETLRQMVMAGAGVALLPEVAPLAPFGTGELAAYLRFERPEPVRELVLAWRRTFPRGDALQALARTLRAALT
jgi:LysR family hydrogen peroxide-inducible transcriptional activator